MMTLDLADVQAEVREWSQTPGGQMILGHLVAKYGFQMMSTFSGDPSRCVYHEGQRSVIAYLTFLVNGPDIQPVSAEIEKQMTDGYYDS